MGFVEPGPILLNLWGCIDIKDESIIKWRCTAPKRDGEGQFNRIISCSNEAHRNQGFGWICECGRWTTGSDAYHKPLKIGIRPIINCGNQRKSVDIKQIMVMIPEPRKRYLPDITTCKSCKIPVCPGSVRFDKNYFELGYIETNLPMCPHVEYEED
ncbi:Uncharacterised protein [uncultured archaeon]|nr:Uncharacterised protein [uncultured archaeon]